MLHFCRAPDASGFGIFPCTPVFFVKTKSPVFPCGNKEGGKKGYLTIPDKPRTVTVQGQAGMTTGKDDKDFFVILACLPAGRLVGNHSIRKVFSWGK